MTPSLRDAFHSLIFSASICLIVGLAGPWSGRGMKPETRAKQIRKANKLTKLFDRDMPKGVKYATVTSNGNASVTFKFGWDHTEIYTVTVPFHQTSWPKVRARLLMFL
jgi:hypothetical protein